MKTLCALVSLLLLAGCATPNYSGLSFEQRMQLYNAMRSQPTYQVQPYQMKTQTQTNCQNTGYGNFNCTSY